MPHERVTPPGGLTICDVFVPGGVDVGIYAPVLHRRKEVFGEDVHIFRPERWLEGEEKTARMRNAMFTFSHGKYNVSMLHSLYLENPSLVVFCSIRCKSPRLTVDQCLGKNIARMEMYKFIPTVLRRFKVSFPFLFKNESS